MVLLDLADSPWVPVLLVVAAAVVMVVLFLSMRHHLRKIDIPPEDSAGEAGADRPRSDQPR